MNRSTVCAHFRPPMGEENQALIGETLRRHHNGARPRHVTILWWSANVCVPASGAFADAFRKRGRNCLPASLRLPDRELFRLSVERAPSTRCRALERLDRAGIKLRSVPVRYPKCLTLYNARIMRRWTMRCDVDWH